MAKLPSWVGGHYNSVLVGISSYVVSVLSLRKWKNFILFYHYNLLKECLNINSVIHNIYCVSLKVAKWHLKHIFRNIYCSYARSKGSNSVGLIFVFKLELTREV